MLALESLQAAVTTARQQLLQNHRKDFSAAELDAGVGTKALVPFMGGGGGAGYV